MQKRRILSCVLAALLLITSTNTSQLALAAQNDEVSAIATGDTTETADSEMVVPLTYKASKLDRNAPAYASDNKVMLFSGAASESKYMSTLEELSIWPDTRSQSPYGTCWAFASTAAAEFSYIAQGYGTKDTVDLSELQVAYFSNFLANEPMGGFSGDEITANKDTFLDNGGTTMMSSRSLLAWRGYTNESQLPYASAETTKTNDLTPSDAYGNNVAYLTDVRRINLNSNRADAKQAIIDNGSLIVSYYDDVNEGDRNYSSAYNSYYCNQVTQINHAVCIVGWDDDFPAENFRYTPEGDGAWLIRNSWSTTAKMSHHSYFWMSYYDKSLTDSAMEFIVTPASEYDNNYQYDGGDYTLSAYGQSAANVYTVAGADGVDQELLKAVQFTVNDRAGLNYTIEVYTNLADKNDPTSGTLAATDQGTLQFAGTYTVPLENPVRMYRGDNFAVVVSLDDGQGHTYVPDVEYAVSYPDGHSCKVSALAGQSFRLTNGNWSQVIEDSDSKSGNYTIKALTANATDIPENTYRIRYDANGAGGQMADSLCISSDLPFTLSANQFSRVGLTFKGWNTKADGSGQAYADQAQVVGIGPSKGCVTLYAQWEASNYNVVLDANGGVGSMDDVLFDYGTQYTLPVNAYQPANDTLQFNGWNTAADGSGVAYADYASVIDMANGAAAITLYAQWKTESQLYGLDYTGTKVQTYSGNQREAWIPEGPYMLYGIFGNDVVERVHLADSTTVFTAYAFEDCRSLKEVYGLDHVENIGYRAFRNCTSLESVEFGDSVTTMANSIFDGCTSLAKVRLPDSITSVPTWCFSGCINLTDVHLPIHATVVGRNAFENCKALTSIVIPETVETIEAQAFSGCSSLSEVTLYQNITAITGSEVFPNQPIQFNLVRDSYAETWVKTQAGYRSGNYTINYVNVPEACVVDASGNTTYYDSQTVALAAMTDGATIYIYDDYSQTIQIPIDQSWTMDFTGHEFSGILLGARSVKLQNVFASNTVWPTGELIIGENVTTYGLGLSGFAKGMTTNMKEELLVYDEDSNYPFNYSVFGFTESDTMVAKCGDHYYASIWPAINEAQFGGSVEILTDLDEMSGTPCLVWSQVSVSAGDHIYESDLNMKGGEIISGTFTGVIDIEDSCTIHDGVRFSDASLDVVMSFLSDDQTLVEDEEGYYVVTSDIEAAEEAYCLQVGDQKYKSLNNAMEAILAIDAEGPTESGTIQLKVLGKPYGYFGIYDDLENNELVIDFGDYGIDSVELWGTSTVSGGVFDSDDPDCPADIATGKLLTITGGVWKNVDFYVLEDCEEADYIVLGGSFSEYAFEQIEECIPEGYEANLVDGMYVVSKIVSEPDPEPDPNPNPEPDPNPEPSDVTPYEIALTLAAGYENVTEAYIDGVAIPGTVENGQLKVIGTATAKTAVLYKRDANGIPTGMTVYELSLNATSGDYDASLVNGLTDLFSYHGFSIRITGKSGIRVKMGIDCETRDALASTGLDGYTLKEYGMLGMVDSLQGQYPFVYGGEKVKVSPAFIKATGYNSVYETVSGRDRFTSVLVGLPSSQYQTQFAFKAYAVFEKDGQEVIVYGPTMSRDIYSLAQQALASGKYKSGSSAYNFLTSILGTGVSG